MFDGAPMAEAGVVLLVFFLLVMNITLLNLLIAILSTAHGRVEGNADKEAVLSEALIITQYRCAVKRDRRMDIQQVLVLFRVLHSYSLFAVKTWFLRTIIVLPSHANGPSGRAGIT